MDGGWGVFLLLFLGVTTILSKRGRREREPEPKNNICLLFSVDLLLPCIYAQGTSAHAHK
jgi:hypothetical protein